MQSARAAGVGPTVPLYRPLGLAIYATQVALAHR